MHAQFLNMIDYVILGILLLSIIVSLIRGFVREAISLATWAIAIWLTLHFTGPLAEALTKWIHSPTLRYFTAGAVIFLTCTLLGALIGYVIGRLIETTGLSGTDRLLGSVFGLLRGVLLIAVLLLFATLTPLRKEDFWKESLLIPYFKPLEKMLQEYLPSSVGSQFELVDNP